MHFPFEHLQVSSSSEYVDIEFRPILPSSTPRPVSITPAQDSDSQPHGTSLVRTFPAAVVTTHDPNPAAPPSPLNDTSSTLSQPLLQTYFRRPHIQLFPLVPALVPVALNLFVSSSEPPRL
ncbi:hypothetical protein L3X38_001138 [Prunus dulcis]|uniref:Uncharacterized protein n=1 Tax=Prunus dulcis TaxID=3755 RepID=A0AAD4WS37_PRUDU|nr:hypothetical protein L3X38_001138 [Prunus dulcis]